MGASRISSTISMWRLGEGSEFQIDLDEVMGRPRPVVVKGEITVEQLRRFKYVFLERRLRLASHQAGEVHDLSLVAAAARLGLETVPAQDGFHAVRIGVPVLAQDA